MISEFENYGLRAKQNLSSTEMSGRYPSQVEAERRILLDVIEKLSISPTDRLLDIGCGTGLLLIPLSFAVDSVVGVDHPDVCKVLEARIKCQNVRLFHEDFMSAEFGEEIFDKIVCYGVLQTLATLQDLHLFIEKAVSLLRPGGKMLLGDIPNIDKKHRFQNSSFGQEFERDWANRGLSESNVDVSALVPNPPRVHLDDGVVTQLVLKFRNLGFDSYLLPQPHNLPWGHTREDLLVVRPL